MKKAARIWRGIFCCVIPVLVLFWKLPPVGEKRYYALQALVEGFRYGNYIEFWNQSEAGPALMLCHFLALFTALLYCIRICLLLLKRNIKILDALSRGTAGTALLMALLASESFGVLSKELYGLLTPFFVAVVAALEYVGFRFLDEWSERIEEYYALKKRDRLAKIRRKKALYFPGKYPKEFLTLIKNSYVGNRKSSILFLLGGTFVMSYSILIFGLSRIMLQIQNGEELSEIKMIVSIFMGGGGILSILCLMMMYYVVSDFIKKRIKNYQIFVLFGIRRRTRYQIFTSECALNILISIVAGTILGTAIYAGISRWIEKSDLCNKNIDFAAAFSIPVAGYGIVLFFVIMTLSFLFNQENILRMGNSTVLSKTKEADRIPKGIWGIFLMAFIIFDGTRELFEVRGLNEISISYIGAEIGVLLWVAVVLKYYLRRERKKKTRGILFLRNANLRYRYSKNKWYISLMAAVHFAVLAFLGIPIISSLTVPKTEGLFPYNIVINAYDEDMGALKQITGEHHAKIQCVPMFRMTSKYAGDSAPKNIHGSVLMPQGQNVGISESTYEMLKKQRGEKIHSLNLKDDEIYIVYQQDTSQKARLIDTSGSMENRMRIGQPLNFYSTEGRNPDKIFLSWKIKGEEKDILTGMFYNGKQENLVVFSDKKFEEIHEKISAHNQKNMEARLESHDENWNSYLQENGENITEGPTNLLLCKVPEKEYEDMMQELSFLKEKYPMDSMWDERIQPVYGSKEIADSVNTERLTNLLYYMQILFLILPFALVQSYIKIEGEMEDMVWQNRFLAQMGMKEKERRKLLRSGLYFPLYLSGIIGIITGVLFWNSVWEVRLYFTSEVITFVKTALVYSGIYFVIWWLWLLLQEKRVWKKVKSKNEV